MHMHKGDLHKKSINLPSLGVICGKKKKRDEEEKGKKYL